MHNESSSLRLKNWMTRQFAALSYDLSWRFGRPGSFRRRIDQAITNLPQGICLYDRDDRLQLVNQRFCNIYGLAIARLRLGMSFFEVMQESCAVGNYHGQSVEAVWSARKAFIDRREQGTFFQELGDGRLIEISHQPLDDGGWVCTYEDITEQRNARAKVDFLAHHDSLTELPNRTLFSDRLKTALAAASATAPCCLLCLDLDGFKRVNDRLGHSAGDLLLKEVAARILRWVPDGATPARLGGDEFAVVLPDTLPAAAFALGERLCAAVREPYTLDGFGTATVAASAGIACSPLDADRPEELLLMADRALYRSKSERRGNPNLFFDAPLVPEQYSDSCDLAATDSASSR